MKTDEKPIVPLPPETPITEPPEKTGYEPVPEPPPPPIEDPKPAA